MIPRVFNCLYSEGFVAQAHPWLGLMGVLNQVATMGQQQNGTVPVDAKPLTSVASF
jgi:hypothetical protein